MIPESTLSRWRDFSEQYHFNTLSQFIMTAVEYFIRSL